MPVVPPANNATKIAKSVGTIVQFCILWPVFVTAIHAGPEIVYLPARVVGMLLVAPGFLVVAILAFFGATFVPALAIGSFVALLSPSILRTRSFLLAATVVAAVISALWCVVMGNLWTTQALRFIAIGALASLCCALIVSRSRSRPTEIHDRTDSAAPALHSLPR